MTTYDDTLHAHDRLTDRECQAMDWLILGYTTKEIAEKMAVEDHTVEYFLKQSFGKLGASNRVQAAILYIRFYWLNHLPSFWRRWQQERKERDL